jgi:hypothetical protein
VIEPNHNPFASIKPYVPATLSEIWDLLASMILGAPKFDRFIMGEEGLDAEFRTLVSGFDRVRTKLGEERYAKLIDLAARAKTLFAEDQEDTNGKTNEGRELLFDIEEIIQEVRRSRAKAKLKDDEGEVTGD